MIPSDSLAVASIVAAVLWLIFGLAYYVWYAIALSKTFPKLGREGWKGWVPVLNEIEILTLGGVPGWSVLFYFIPIVQLYGLYLKATAVHRINLQFQRGTGMTVLGILIPPLWASILAWGRTPASEFDQRVTSMMPAQPVAGVGPLSAPPVIAPPVPVARTVPAPAPVVSAPPVPPVPLAPPVPPPAPVPVAAIPAAEVVAPAATGNPWAPRAPEAEPVASVPVEVPPPVRAVTPPPVEAPVAAPVAAVIVDSVEPDDDDEDDEDEYAATVVVDRRPRVQWKLVLDSGRAFDLTADRVALGRNPASDDPDAQLLSVPDSTRTLSKTHATLELKDGEWTVTDLHSTNGVIVVGAEDAETLLAPGRSSAVPERFILGKVGMHVENAEGTAK